MTWKRAGIGAGLLVVAVILGFLMWPSDDEGAGARADARRVNCLDSANRQRLVDIAKTIDVVKVDSNISLLRPSSKPGRPVTIETWSQQGHSGFDRACNAFTALTARPLLDPKPQALPLHSFLTAPAVNAMLGGVLTMAGGALASRRDRRRTLADAVHTAATEYDKVARAYAWKRAASTAGQPEHDALDTCHAELWFAIERGYADQRGDELHEFLDRTHALLTNPEQYRRRDALDELDRLRTAITGTGPRRPAPSTEPSGEAS